MQKVSLPITPLQLNRHIDWKGAFVIGLAGTILVTGVTGPVLAGLGSAAIPNFVITTLAGFLLCLFLAELAAMFPGPDRRSSRLRLHGVSEVAKGS